jgi:iron complex outermembrane receptor protein
MRGLITTDKKHSLTQSLLQGVTALALAGVIATPAAAQGQMEGILEEIIVTAQKREEALQDVPISVATTSGEKLNAMFSGGEDVLALSGRVPGLYAESSNGRAAPRFYLRGLGNIDFDLGASQPVSYIMDEVVMENVVLKSFPLFDVQNIEVIRGPQGTLFGRNTIAGIVKVNTRRPDEETSGYVKGSFATHSTINLEGAVGGSLSDTVNGRISALYRSRDDWITNGQTGEESLGEFEETAVRAQLEWMPSDTFSALLSLQTRSLDGTASIFRANVFTTGSSDLNQNYDRDTVWYDGGDNNPQGYDSTGITLNLTWDLDNFSINSITSFQDADGSSRGDIDGGVVNIFATPTPPSGLTFADTFVLCPDPCLPARTWPGEILVPSVTEDGADTDQFTQEFRISSDTDGAFSWQAGAFFFDSSLKVETENFASAGFVDVANNIVEYENSAWAVFGQGSYDVTDRLTLTGGVRYTNDEKDFTVLQQAQLWADLGVPVPSPINVDDGETSWELSANYAMSDQSSLYGRVASGFRAQTIQGRDVAFSEVPTVAEPETITSFEAGYKADLANDRFRLNVGVFAYEVDDMQLSVIGGASNTNQVVNADKGEAVGFEIDAQWLATDNLLISGGFAYNDTEINDATLATAPCGSGLCTVLNPLEDPDDPDNPKVLVNGNPFPRAPETTYNLEVRYSAEIGANSEIYFLTDWVWYGKINMPLYEAVEFKTDSQYEGGLRIGYRNNETGLEVAAFGRNITDEDNVLGFIDFSNNTGFVNEPTVWGVEVGYEFGD